MLILNYIIASLITIATLEYFTHKYLMHKRYFAGSVILDGFFVRHSLWHHRDERNDTNIDFPWAYALFYSLWPAILMVYIDLTFSYIFIGMSLLYAIYWTKLHRAFHNLEVNWTMKLPWYRTCWNHHINHHFFPKKNYGTVFWMSDYLFGTKI